MTAAELKTSLKKSGLRSTKDRCRILERFAEQRTWTVPELYQTLRSMDLSTVYRNVQKLADSGLLAVAHLHDRQPHYELTDRSHHAHLICERCRTAECVPCPIDRLGTRHELELKGLCSACS